MSILVIIPTRRDLDAEVAYRSFQAEQAMREKCRHVDIVRHFDATCPRDEIVKYLGDQHSHVLLIPDNAVVYDPLLPGLLVQISSDSAIGPAVKPQGQKAALSDIQTQWMLDELPCVLMPAEFYRKDEYTATGCQTSGITVWTANADT